VFGLATMLQMSFSMPTFSVWTVPERAAPLSRPTRIRLSMSGGIYSWS